MKLFAGHHFLISSICFLNPFPSPHNISYRDATSLYVISRPHPLTFPKPFDHLSKSKTLSMISARVLVRLWNHSRDSVPKQRIHLNNGSETVSKWIVSCSIAFFCCFIYLYGVVQTCRYSVNWEILITLGFPFVIWQSFIRGSKQYEEYSPRMEQLIQFETFFNVLVVGNKVCLMYSQLGGLRILFNYCFVSFFALQTYGFVQAEISRKQWLGVVRSLSLFLNIMLQRYRSSPFYFDSFLDGEGRFLMWGGDAPTMMIVHYFFWVLAVLIVEYVEHLPYSLLHCFHLASVTLAAFSGEFWHVRILTACHLFVMDALMLYKQGRTLTIGSSQFATMPKHLIALNRQYLVPSIQIFSTLGCLGCVFFSYYCGQDTLFCYSFNPFLSYQL